MLLGQAGNGPHQGQGVGGVQAPAIVGIVAIGRRIKGIGGSLSGVGAVLIVGYADPVHILVAGVELRNGVVPVADGGGGEHGFDVGILVGLGGDLLEGLDERAAVDVGPVVHLPADAQQNCRIQVTHGLQALGDVAVGGAVQHPLGPGGGLRAEIPGQLDDPAVGSGGKGGGGALIIVDPVVHGIAVHKVDIHQAGGLAGAGPAHGGAVPGAVGRGPGAGEGLARPLLQGIDLHAPGGVELLQPGVDVQQGIFVAGHVLVQPLGKCALPFQPLHGPGQVALHLGTPGGPGALAFQIVADVGAQRVLHQQVIGLLGHGEHLVGALGGHGLAPGVVELPIGGGIGVGRGGDAHPRSQGSCHGHRHQAAEQFFHEKDLLSFNFSQKWALLFHR